MDFVPSQQRARWKSLESVAVFGWCGSAALGGYLADQPGVGYTGTFLYTAGVQGAAVLLQASLLLIVPLHEKRSDEGKDGGGGTAAASQGIEPLLAEPPRSDYASINAQPLAGGGGACNPEAASGSERGSIN